MTVNKTDIINAAAGVFSKEGYLTPTVDQLSQAAGISKMTLYRHFRDKETLIIATLRNRQDFFLQEIRSLVAAEQTPRARLYAVFRFYEQWFASPDFYGCMFSKAVNEYGRTLQDVMLITAEFKHEMCRMFADILRAVLKPEPAERCACITMMLIDGAIAAAQAAEVNSEYPPAITAWQAVKAVIFSEGGEI
ncbi:TetR/AcrR family transcriptional regulator [Klebsiella aerogenes]|uniref:TetR/AcrR family transcriptional regulator n=1 Tax=Klebsiella aerogenes TaxID=548 RepID=UPI00178C56C9|nr:TetR/AcrR family transcriptional regulator [Klebsiella aerogenes]